MKTLVLHETQPIWPLDPDMFGQTYVVQSLVQRSALPNAVLTRGYSHIPAWTSPAYERMSEASGVPLFHADYVPSLNDLRKALLARETGRAQKRYESTFIHDLEARTRDADEVLFVSHYPKSGVKMGPLLKRLLGPKVKTIVEFHCLAELYKYLPRGTVEQNPEGLPEYVTAPTRRLMDSDADAFVAVSDATKRSFTDLDLLSEERIRVIRNGVDERLYSPCAGPRQPIVGGDYVVGYAGRLDVVKGAEILKELLLIAEDDKENRFGFVFASTNGTDRESRRGFAEHVLRNTPRLVQEGRVKLVVDTAKLEDLTRGGASARIDGYYDALARHDGIAGTSIDGGILRTPVQRHIDCYVQPSLSEAIGLSILEAQACGVPVVATRVGGMPEVVGEGDGYLVDLDGTARTARSIYSCLIDAKARSGNGGFAGIRNSFMSKRLTASHMAAQNDALYEELLRVGAHR